MQELFMWGICGLLALLTGLYFVIKWAVTAGIKAAYRDITGKKTAEEQMLEQLARANGK